MGRWASSTRAAEALRRSRVVYVEPKVPACARAASSLRDAWLAGRASTQDNSVSRYGGSGPRSDRLAEKRRRRSCRQARVFGGPGLAGVAAFPGNRRYHARRCTPVPYRLGTLPMDFTGQDRRHHRSRGQSWDARSPTRFRRAVQIECWSTARPRCSHAHSERARLPRCWLRPTCSIRATSM